MDEAQTQVADQELDVSIAGQSVRAKGYRLVDLIWLPLVLGTAYTCFMMYQHDAAARDDKATLAATLRESNAAIATALKENNANVVGALKDLATEQRRSTKAMKETACLLDPAIKNRGDGREFCKRMVRDEP